MAAPAVSFESIQSDINRNRLAPVYILHGDEGFYVDRLTAMFENLVPENERDFNLFTFYAPETGAARIISACRSFPMMGERQVVIVKEAQASQATEINKLSGYLASPSNTTVLVICFRGAEAKGKDLMASAKKGGAVVYASKRVYDSKLPTVIQGFIKEKGLNIEPKAITMLGDYIGTDLSRLYGEIDKLSLVLGKGAMVTPEAIERNIGISKDYNNFELVSAVAARDYGRMMRIAYYFRSNPKNSPTTLTASALFNFFSGLLKCQFSKDKSPSSLMGLLGLKWPVQFKDYEQGLKRYSARQSLQAISEIRRFDCMTKGIGSRRNEYDLLQELLYRLITLKGV